MYGEDPEDWLYDQDDDYESASDEIELAMQDCGQNAAGDWCDLAGTEHCDFRCPFRNSFYDKLKEQKHE